MFDFLAKVFQELAKIPSTDGIVNIIAAVILSLLFYGFRWLLKNAGPYVLRLYQANWKLARAESAVSSTGQGIWLAKIEKEPPKDYIKYFSDRNTNRIPIIVIANLKGGVGKTTTAANLAAHYAIKKNESVLLIDFDYQGSLSSMALSNENLEIELNNQAAGGNCRASSMLDNKDVDWLLNAALPIENVPNSRIIPSFYSLASMENRIMVEWLIAKRSHDIRYQLASLLHDPRVAGRFKRVIIDAPPRLTTACIEALCAATHVIIPTILDKLSAEAVGTFAQQINTHRELWPHLTVIGAFGTMTEMVQIDTSGDAIEGNLRQFENDAISSVNDALRAAFAGAPLALANARALPFECFTPNKVELATNAGKSIAYAVPGNALVQHQIRASFDRLGDEIDGRIGWSQFPPPTLPAAAK